MNAPLWVEHLFITFWWVHNSKPTKKWWLECSTHKGAFIINDFLKYSHFRAEVFCSFFGRIENKIISFSDYLTFSQQPLLWGLNFCLQQLQFFCDLPGMMWWGTVFYEKFRFRHASTAAWIRFFQPSGDTSTLHRWLFAESISVRLNSWIVMSGVFWGGNRRIWGGVHRA